MLFVGMDLHAGQMLHGIRGVEVTVILPYVVAHPLFARLLDILRPVFAHHGVDLHDHDAHTQLIGDVLDHRRRDAYLLPGLIEEWGFTFPAPDKVAGRKGLVTPCATILILSS